MEPRRIKYFIGYSGLKGSIELSFTTGDRDLKQNIELTFFTSVEQSKITGILALLHRSNMRPEYYKKESAAVLDALIGYVTSASMFTVDTVGVDYLLPTGVGDLLWAKRENGWDVVVNRKS